MLRASSLGLTFTHGISRSALLQHTLYIHELVHESSSLACGAARFYSTSKAQVATASPIVGRAHTSPTPHESLIPTKTLSRPTSPTERKTTCRAGTETPFCHRTSRNSDMTSTTQGKRRRRGPSIERHSAQPTNISPPLSREAYREYRSRLPLYERLAQDPDIDAAWEAYRELLSSRPQHLTRRIPQKYLHTFAARLVAASKWKPSNRNRTQKVFLRLLSVLDTIYHTGGQLRLWEWNALIECSGRGWRKTRMDDFNASLNVFRDMVDNRVPGASLSNDPYLSLQDTSRVVSQPVTPDIVSYTTLVNIAGRTLDESTLALAESMLVSSGLPPNRITYLAYIRHYTRRGDLSQVRLILSRIKARGIELGIDGINGCIWAYGRNGRLDISTLIYRILRHNMHLETRSDDEETVKDAIQELAELEGLVIPPGLTPDAITYYTLVQSYAYRGQLYPSLEVLKDMMTLPQPVTGRLEDVDVFISGPSLPNPILPIFRAIFLGFARHAVPPGHLYDTSASAPHTRLMQGWTLEQLQILFANFMDLPGDAKPNTRTFWWLLVAFAITSGYDRALLRGVWDKVSARYGTWWDGRVYEFRDKIDAEEFDRAYFDEVCSSRGRARARIRDRSQPVY